MWNDIMNVQELQCPFDNVCCKLREKNIWITWNFSVFFIHIGKEIFKTIKIKYLIYTLNITTLNNEVKVGFWVKIKNIEINFRKNGFTRIEEDYLEQKGICCV